MADRPLNLFVICIAISPLIARHQRRGRSVCSCIGRSIAGQCVSHTVYNAGLRRTVVNKICLGSGNVNLCFGARRGRRGRAPPDFHFAWHEILCICTIRLGLIIVGDRFSVCVHRQDTGRLIHCAALPVDRSFGIKPWQSFHVKGSSGRQSALIIKLLII